MKNFWQHSCSSHESSEYIWEQSLDRQATCLVFSWNASREAQRRLLFSVSLHNGTDWSSWIDYAYWGSDGQGSFLSTQDELPLAEETQAFRLRVKSITQDNLEGVKHLFACSNMPGKNSFDEPPKGQMRIPVPELSQYLIPHPDSNRLCSPATATALIHAYDPASPVSALTVTEQVWDDSANNYGNWSFAAAAIAEALGPNWCCWVDRLNGMTELLNLLSEKQAVGLSVQGPLQGSEKPYLEGHLLVACGFDSDKQSLLCMDPAGSPAESLFRWYKFSDFNAAWARRGYTAYRIAPHSAS